MKKLIILTILSLVLVSCGTETKEVETAKTAENTGTITNIENPPTESQETIIDTINTTSSGDIEDNVFDGPRGGILMPGATRFR